jgi:hypothetical protein
MGNALGYANSDPDKEKYTDDSVGHSKCVVRIKFPEWAIEGVVRFSQRICYHTQIQRIYDVPETGLPN